MFAFWYLVKKNCFLKRFRSSSLEVFCEKVVLKKFKKLTVKHLRQSLNFNKVAGHSGTGVFLWILGNS